MIYIIYLLYIYIYISILIQLICPMSICLAKKNNLQQFLPSAPPGPSFCREFYPGKNAMVSMFPWNNGGSSTISMKFVDICSMKFMTYWFSHILSNHDWDYHDFMEHFPWFHGSFFDISHYWLFRSLCCGQHPKAWADTVIRTVQGPSDPDPRNRRNGGMGWRESATGFSQPKMTLNYLNCSV